MGARISADEFFQRVKTNHPDLDFSLSVYKNMRSMVDFVCPKHGPRSVIAAKLNEGRGCPTCGRSESAKAKYAAGKGLGSLGPRTEEEKRAMAARARAGRTAESFAHLSRTMKQHWAALAPEDHAARVARLVASSPAVRRKSR